MKIIYLHCKEQSNKSVDGQVVQDFRICSPDQQIIDILKEEHEVILVDFREDYQKLVKEINPDVVFNCADGFDNCKDEADIPKTLEKLGFYYTGCSGDSILLCSDKGKAKEVFVKNKVLTPKYQVFSSKNDVLDNNLKFPLIVKPTKSDASYGIDEDSVVDDENKLRKKLDSLFENYDQILVEEYIEGREFCIPMIGNDKVLVLPPLEIDYGEHFEEGPKILSYKAKWSKNSNAFKSTYSIVAKDLDPKLEASLKSNAKKVFELLGCSGYASADFRVDKDGNIYVLEVNPNPYLAKDADIIKASTALGLTPIQLFNKIIQFSVEKKELASLVVARARK